MTRSARIALKTRLRAAESMKPRSSPPSAAPAPTRPRPARALSRLRSTSARFPASRPKRWLAEVVGHAARGDPRDAFAEQRRVTRQAARDDREAVSLERAARQFSLVCGRREYFVTLAREADEFLGRPLAARHGEVLRGDRVAILESGESHLERLAAHRARELARDPLGVGAAFANGQQGMRPLAARRRSPGSPRLRSLPAWRAASRCRAAHPTRWAEQAPRAASARGSSILFWRRL